MIWQPLLISLAILQAQSAIDDVPKKYVVPAPTPDKVVAKVNGVDIKASEINDLLWQARGLELTNDVILYTAIKQDAKKKGIADLTEKEVDEAFTEQLSQASAGLKPGEKLEDALHRDGFSFSRLYLRMRMQLMIDRILTKDFKPANFVKVSTIIVKPASPANKDVAEASKRADDLYARLKKGESWEGALNSATLDAKVRGNKGLLGWREISAFPELAQQELAAIKPGGVTKPFQTSYGIQIFRLEARGVGANKQELAELKSQYMSAMVPQYLNQLQKEAKIERFLPGT
jgi:hypothetical protein